MLTDAHLAHLRISGLTDATIAGANIHSSESECQGIVFPHYGLSGPSGYAVVRLDDPGEGGKYRGPGGVRVAPYFSPVGPKHSDAMVPLLHTEGVKKALAAAQVGVCACVSFQGLWPHDVVDRHQTGDRVLHHDFDAIPLRGRTVYVAYDGGDVDTRADIATHEAWTALMFRAKGAKVRLLRIPAEGGRKVGLDDYLAAGGDLRELIARAKNPMRMPAKSWIFQAFCYVASESGNRRLVERLEGLPGVGKSGLKAAIKAWKGEIDAYNLSKRAKAEAKADTRVRIPVEPKNLHVMVEAYKRALRENTYTVSGRVATVEDGVMRIITQEQELITVGTQHTVFTKGEGGEDTAPHIPTIRSAVSALWRDRELKGIMRDPFVAPDGRVVTEEGYDAGSGWYLHGAGRVDVPEEPTRGDASWAYEQLCDIYREFEFAEGMEEVGPAVMVSLILSLVGRPAIDGPVPLHLVSAALPGTGKDLAIELACLVATGKDTTDLPHKDDTEMSKSLLGLVAAGVRCARIGNMVKILKNPCLTDYLSKMTHSDRVLGKSENVSYPATTVITASGNNPLIGEDLGRRTVVCELTSSVEDPSKRVFEDPDVRGTVLRRRKHFLSCALTLLKAHIGAGQPLAPMPAMGSYGAYTRVVRGAIVWAGGADPGTSIGLVKSDIDIQAEDRDATMQILWDTFGEKPFSSEDVYMLAQKADFDVVAHLSYMRRDAKLAGMKLAHLAKGVWQGRILRKVVVGDKRLKRWQFTSAPVPKARNTKPVGVRTRT